MHYVHYVYYYCYYYYFHYHYYYYQYEVRHVEEAPALPRHAAVPTWWPPVCHAAACAALLRATGAGTLGEAIYIYMRVYMYTYIYIYILPCANSFYPNASSIQHAEPKLIIQGVAE